MKTFTRVVVVRTRRENAREEKLIRLLLKYLRPSAASTEQGDATRREERTSEIQAFWSEITVVPSPTLRKSTTSELALIEPSFLLRLRGAWKTAGWDGLSEGWCWPRIPQDTRST